MKSESVKSLIACYLREKQSSSHYDEVDGLSLAQCSLAGESFGSRQNRCAEMLCVAPAAPQPVLGDYLGPLEPQEESIVRGIGRQLCEIAEEFELDHMKAIENQASALGSKMVQFKHRCMPVAPSCGHIEIPVVRMGNSGGTANVAWRTINKTAIAGAHYSSSRGDISFAEGDKEKTIEIEIIRNQGDSDVCFVVELFNPEGTEVGAVNPLTVYITDHTNLYDDEKQVVENIINCGPNTSITNISWCLRDKVTVNTFKAALQCACSNANSIPEELALGFELLRVSLQSARFDQLTNVICNFFNHLPELEDIAQYFDEFN
ncbi:hypothetical protein JTE90_026340 [Oedothorax gibbosus]|uniref:Calx-beta domain-containing protein n=1 Tax=Oedothorax gibbosus TaxID=931172 RepID=A0AAV6U6Z7_9ARAC|nr:hypothetical protein JTE90_026340 [Oedothorax gibbosus]